jgi:uncharacterized 2Fe-2S/4Fe-4S cluster protein (DUF4445 family)
MNKYNIHFQPMDLTGEFPENTSLLECARKLGINLVTICSGRGTCGKCLVKVTSGSVSEIDEVEKKHVSPADLSQGYRLACKTHLKGTCRIEIPTVSLSTLQRAQVEGQEIEIAPEPRVRAFYIHLPPPSLNSQQADFERLQASLSQHGQTITTADIGILQQISSVLRTCQWSVLAVLRDNELIGLLEKTASPLGLAVDLGTTKIAVYLVNLNSGKTLQARGIMNPQASFGADIISRMTAAIHSPDDANKLRELVVNAINTAAIEMCRTIQADPLSIVDTVIVGNTAMHHLFLGLPVKQLCSAPFIPSVDSPLDIKARRLGLIGAAGSYIHFLPNIAGYVGADHIAMILSTGLNRNKGVVLALDIGTNTEICLSDRGKMSSLSCASGPAFEGAHIKHGMRVAKGAIEHFRLTDNRIEFQTIGGGHAVGICGSGIIDITAQLFLNGIIDTHGRMRTHERVREKEGVIEFVVASSDNKHPDITFTQKDVREIQLAKGAIRSGIEVLLQTNKLTHEDIDEIIIAGAFGTYLDVESAVAIGMLPDLPAKCFHQVGNAAGMGAIMALVSQNKRREAQEIASQVRHIELATYPDFNKIFARATGLGINKNIKV